MENDEIRNTNRDQLNSSVKRDMHDGKDIGRKNKPDGLLPEDDPAIINPDELATFPKQAENEDPDIENERDPHLVNRKKSPVRDGRNITRTDPNPETDGFM